MESDVSAPTTKALIRTSLLRGTGTVLLGMSAVITAVIAFFLLHDNRELRHENTCRFDVSTEVNTIADNITALTAEIFVAAINEDDSSVARLGEELDEEVHKLRPALVRRRDAIDLCN